jgi:putative transcriptional regulator
MSKLGSRLIKAAREGRAIARGEADAKSYRVFVPAEVDVRAIRTALHLSQAQFAARFGLPAATIREWEQNRRQPDGAARVLLQVIKKEPEAVSRALEPTPSRRQTAHQQPARALI